MSGEDAHTEAEVAEGESQVADPEVAKLKTELEAATRQIEGLLERLRRSQADYENLQKRTAREVDVVREAANEALLASFLPVLDDFDHAIAGVPGEAGEGLRLLHANLSRVLAEAGLEPIHPMGKPFDPYDHEVVGQANDEGLSDGLVKEVVQTGYRYRRRLLRPAKVIVVKRGD